MLQKYRSRATIVRMFAAMLLTAGVLSQEWIRVGGAGVSVGCAGGEVVSVQWAVGQLAQARSPPSGASATV